MFLILIFYLPKFGARSEIFDKQWQQQTICVDLIVSEIMHIFNYLAEYQRSEHVNYIKPNRRTKTTINENYLKKDNIPISF